jgi:hypothetical protein
LAHLSPWPRCSLIPLRHRWRCCGPSPPSRHRFQFRLESHSEHHAPAGSVPKDSAHTYIVGYHRHKQPHPLTKSTHTEKFLSLKITAYNRGPAKETLFVPKTTPIELGYKRNIPTKTTPTELSHHRNIPAKTTLIGPVHYRNILAKPHCEYLGKYSR